MRNIKLFLIVAISVVSILFVAGAQAANKDYIIAVIPKGESHAYWKSVEVGAKKAGKDLGCTVIFKGPAQESDRAQQIQLVEGYVSENVSGICLAPLDSDALVDPVALAKQNNIPVVIFDSALKGTPGKDFLSFVATDNYKGGEMAGNELARELHDQGKVVMLRYAVGSASTEQREKGFLDAIAKFPKIDVIEKDRYGGATLNEAQRNAENILDRLQLADGIFCPNESTTQAMMNVLADNGMRGKKKFVGFDTSEALIKGLKEGQIQALVAQNPKYMGYMSVKTIVDHLNGQKVPATIDTGCMLVTPKNLDTPKVQDLLK